MVLRRVVGGGGGGVCVWGPSFRANAEIADWAGVSRIFEILRIRMTPPSTQKHDHLAKLRKNTKSLFRKRRTGGFNLSLRSSFREAQTEEFFLFETAYFYQRTKE